MTDHSGCSHASHAWKPVKCDRCGREFICTPADDFYCAAEGDHCCEACLLSGAGVTVIEVVVPRQALPTERS